MVTPRPQNDGHNVGAVPESEIEMQPTNTPDEKDVERASHIRRLEQLRNEYGVRVYSI